MNKKPQIFNPYKMFFSKPTNNSQENYFNTKIGFKSRRIDSIWSYRRYQTKNTKNFLRNNRNIWKKKINKLLKIAFMKKVIKKSSKDLESNYENLLYVFIILFLILKTFTLMDLKRTLQVLEHSGTKL